MEHPLSSQADGTNEAEEAPAHIQVAPWNQPGRSWVLRQCIGYVVRELDLGYLPLWSFTPSGEYHTLLLDAYREMVALGLLTPEGDV